MIIKIFCCFQGMARWVSLNVKVKVVRALALWLFLFTKWTFQFLKPWSPVAIKSEKVHSESVLSVAISPTNRCSASLRHLYRWSLVIAQFIWFQLSHSEGVCCWLGDRLAGRFLNKDVVWFQCLCLWLGSLSIQLPGWRRCAVDNWGGCKTGMEKHPKSGFYSNQENIPGTFLVQVSWRVLFFGPTGHDAKMNDECIVFGRRLEAWNARRDVVCLGLSCKIWWMFYPCLDSFCRQGHTDSVVDAAWLRWHQQHHTISSAKGK